MSLPVLKSIVCACIELKEIQKIIENKIGEETDRAVEDSMEQAINESVIEAIEQSVGEAMSASLVAAIEQATGEAIEESIEAELANAIDAEIAYAVSQGIDEAAVTAGWEAYFEVLGHFRHTHFLLSCTKFI